MVSGLGGLGFRGFGVSGFWVFGFRSLVFRVLGVHGNPLGIKGCEGTRHSPSLQKEA